MLHLQKKLAGEVITPVTIVPVTYKSFTSTVSLPASATFLNKSIIRATTTGTIEKILISPGDYIASGQLLFTIRTREAMALKNNVQADTSLSFAGTINITARIEGIINSISYQKGDFVQEGDEMAVVSDQSSLVFILDVPFELDKFIEKNKNCRIILPDNRQISGTITHKLAEMDMPSQTIRYIVKPSSVSSLPGNLIASINLITSTKKDALVLPKQAVLGNETQTEFWVMKLINDSTAIKVSVNKGFENNEEVEIISPEFLPSDRIVLTGNYGLPDTARVKITENSSMKNFFLSYKNPISVILAVIIVGGIFLYGQIQVSLFPEITFPKLKVIADNGEQPVDKMMVTVTRPLEDAIKQVPDLKILRSTTSRGTCEISAFLNWGADINVNQQMMESRISQIKNTLPPDVQIQIEKMNPSILPVIGFTVESDKKTPIELNLIATYIIKPFFSQIDGVSSVGIIGGKTKEFWIELNQLKMSSFSITPEIIRDMLNQNHFLTSNGFLSDYRRMYLNITDAGLYNLSDIENVVLRNDGKRIIRLKDVADVNVRERTEFTRINANGRQGLLVAILKQPGANLISLSKNVESRKKELEKLLPPDVHISLYYDQADFVNHAIKSVNDSLWLGLLLAILVAIMFLRSFRASATILVTIPVTLFLTIIVLYSIGYTLNIMTFGAIAAAIGLIIDDAVVVVEQIHRTHEEFPDRPSDQLVNQAVRYLFPSMVGSSISTIVIFLPFMLLGGVAGAYFNVLTNTMIITLVCSFFVTWIGLPVIYLWFSGIRSLFPEKKKTGIKKTKTRNWVSFFLRRPAISLLFILCLLMSIIFILPRLETGFLPEMDEGSIVLDYKSPPGTSLEETDRILTEVEKIIVTIPEVATYSRRTGAQMGFFITEPNDGDFLIQLKDDRERSTVEVIDDIRKQD